MHDPDQPTPYRDPPQSPATDAMPDEAPNRTGDAEWQPGGDPRHSPKD
jgi:hypothetical protein